MAKGRMTLVEMLRKAGVDGDADFIREGIKVLTESLMELEVKEKARAGLYQRSEDRVTYRNGYRERRWDTMAGTVSLDIPKLREGSHFPSLLEPRHRAKQAQSGVALAGHSKQP